MRSSAWKSVDVSLPDPGSDANHYDSACSRVLKASRDLEAQQYESCGMFYGLQVLDGSMYDLIGNRMIIKTEKAAEKTHELLKGTSAKKKIGGQPESGELDGRHDLVSPVLSSDGHDPQKKRKRGDDASTSGVILANPAEIEDQPTLKKKSKKKKKKKKAIDPDEPQALETQADPMQTAALHDSWLTATNGVALQEQICQSLARQGFQTPTPIQTATLPAAILGRRNIVGAAATGSGKTLAYLIPILQHLLECESGESLPLQALILAPTRELALQVADECEKLMPKTTATIVGGLAPHKQARILDTRKSPIVIGTPGRLWQMVSFVSLVALRQSWSLKRIQATIDTHEQVNCGDSKACTSVRDNFYRKPSAVFAAIFLIACTSFP